MEYRGLALSSGIGIGKIKKITECDLSYKSPKSTDSNTEKLRLSKAIDEFCQNTELIAKDLLQKLSSKDAEILKGHISMAKDPYFIDQIHTLIDQAYCAEDALSMTCDQLIETFSNMDDPFMQERSQDIRDLKRSLLKKLLGVEDSIKITAEFETIIVLSELTPSIISKLDSKNIVGIITEKGGSTSHSAILARGLGIPAISSFMGIMDMVNDDDYGIIDGNNGLAYINPDNATLSSYQDKLRTWQEKVKINMAFANKTSLTGDGHCKKIYCNIGQIDDIQQAMEYGADGIGLFRTEFLFMHKDALPNEEYQFQAYKKVISAMQGKEVIIRTLDIGGDKTLPYLKAEEESNPFLGIRGIRFCLKHDQIFKSQLRAILRASAYGKVKIMLPMITCLEEVRQSKKILSDLMDNLKNDNIDFDKNIALGCMIETSSAAFIADSLAKEVNFFSIGSNDLIQYIMCSDRTNTDVDYLSSCFQPSVLRAIKHIISCANEASIPVGMCGEAAANPAMMPLLIAFGLDEFSVSPSLVPECRCKLNNWKLKDALYIADHVMKLKTKSEVLSYLDKKSTIIQ